MSIKTVLIALFSVATVNALSLEGYKCSEHVVLTGDLMVPLRTVRICGVKDYAEAQNYVNYRTVSGIKGTALSSVAQDDYLSSLDTTSPLLSNGNEVQQLSTVIFQTVPISTRLYETLKYPSSEDTTNLVEKYKSLQQKLNSIVEDTSQTKASVEKVVNYVNNILDTLLEQKGNTKTGNINNKQALKVHLEPSFTALLTKFLQLPKVDVSTEQPVDAVTPKSTELSNASNSNENYTEKRDITEETTQFAEENNSDEKNSEQRDNTEETTEDYDSWIRLHFGPATTMRGETTEMSSDDSSYSYEESSDEKNSEERDNTEETTEDYDSWIRLHFGPATTKRGETTEMSSDDSSYSYEESSEQ